MQNVGYMTFVTDSLGSLDSFFLKRESLIIYYLWIFLLLVSKMAAMSHILTVVDLKISCSSFDAMWNMPMMYITIKPAIPFAN